MTRLGILALGLVGLWWSTTTLPVFYIASPIRDITGRIVADERFKAGVLSEMLAYIQEHSTRLAPGASISRASALIRLALAEKVAARLNGMDDADRQIIGAEQDIRLSLGQNPTDSFLWMLLYSVAMARYGFDSANVKYLIQSYQVGPSEGWVALRRNSLSLGVFTFLDVSFKRVVVTEFAQIVDAGFSDEAALILEGVGWAHREELLPALTETDFVSRRNLYGRLSADGRKLEIPGVPYDERPWR